MEKRTFTNELGNKITISVEKDIANMSARIGMESKDSVTTNVITYGEASVLKELLYAAGF